MMWMYTIVLYLQRRKLLLVRNAMIQNSENCHYNSKLCNVFRTLKCRTVQCGRCTIIRNSAMWHGKSDRKVNTLTCSLVSSEISGELVRANNTQDTDLCAHCLPPQMMELLL